MQVAERFDFAITAEVCDPARPGGGGVLAVATPQVKEELAACFARLLQDAYNPVSMARSRRKRRPPLLLRRAITKRTCPCRAVLA